MIHVLFNPTAGTKSAESKKLAEKIGDFLRAKRLSPKMSLILKTSPRTFQILQAKTGLSLRAATERLTAL